MRYPHLFLTTPKQLLVIEWNVIPHPQYSLISRPRNFHLFRWLQNFFIGKKLFDQDNYLFAKIPEKLWKEEILKFEERWAKVVEQIDRYRTNKKI